MLLDSPPFDDNLSPLHSTVMPHILTLATSTPESFRDTLTQLPRPIRDKLEASVRYNVVSSQQKEKRQQQELQQKASRIDDGKQPTIQLKMNFGNFT
ncbi:hypothetical protein BC941DRAFT_28373 [Chlamydoabsidia padenii]|nr:hypothetical protein BC941DRAFT_28373 [Chlamydoabsidia padenii]